MTEHDIDWDCNEAKGCDWVLYSKECSAHFFYKNKPETDGYYWDVVQELLVNYYRSLKRPAKKDEPENIYTEEMFDAGEECEVGMSFRDNSGVIYKKLLPSDISGMTVIKDKNGEYCIFCQSGARPFDTHTDKQKLADQIDKYVIDKNINAIDTDKLIDAIMNGEFENIKYTGEK